MRPVQYLNSSYHVYYLVSLVERFCVAQVPVLCFIIKVANVNAFSECETSNEAVKFWGCYTRPKSLMNGLLSLKVIANYSLVG